ncbi:MAG: 1,6-anhydro-N-acetylmuramyl-L-alanine amidase AmpD [Gammaproteobacteria bacterium]
MPDTESATIKPACGPIQAGWLAGVRHVPSPNCDARPAGIEIDLLIIHGISLPPGEYGGGHVEELFTNTLDPQAHPYFAEIAGLRVSAHLFIDRAGQVTQFMSLLDRAWHAGESMFAGRSACNDFSVGIELEGCDEQTYTEPQYRQLGMLTGLLQQEIPAITATRIVGHSDVAPGRKTDPGPGFDWKYFRRLLKEITV